MKQCLWGLWTSKNIFLFLYFTGGFSKNELRSVLWNCWNYSIQVMLFLDFWTKFGELNINKHCLFQQYPFESQGEEKRREKDAVCHTQNNCVTFDIATNSPNMVKLWSPEKTSISMLISVCHQMPDRNFHFAFLIWNIRICETVEANSLWETMKSETKANNSKSRAISTKQMLGLWSLSFSTFLGQVLYTSLSKKNKWSLVRGGTD